MRVWACVIAMLAMSHQAMALSCLRPDVTRAFAAFEATGLPYVIVKGTLEFDEAALPKEDLTRTRPAKTRISARMAGMSLTATGFDAPFDQAIKLVVECTSAWCGGAETGTKFLAFLSRSASGYAMMLDPCGWANFPNPTPQTLHRAHQCFSGGDCVAE